MKKSSSFSLSSSLVKKVETLKTLHRFTFRRFNSSTRQRFTLSTLCALCVLCGSKNAGAQIFTGSVGVIGTSNAVVQANYVTITNTAFVTLPGRTLVLQGINTNETVTASYGEVFSGSGLSNIWVGATNYFTFSPANGWVNGATFVTNIPPITIAVPITPVGQISISGGYSNSVIFN